MGPMQLCRARRYCHCTICTFDCFTLHTLVSFMYVTVLVLCNKLWHIQLCAFACTVTKHWKHTMQFLPLSIFAWWWPSAESYMRVRMTTLEIWARKLRQSWTRNKVHTLYEWNWSDHNVASCLKDIDASGMQHSEHSNRGNRGQLTQMRNLKWMQTEQPKWPSVVDIATQGEEVNLMAPFS